MNGDESLSDVALH